MHGNLMSKFKVQGQVHHLFGSLLSHNPEKPKILEIYFMGDSENEVKSFLKFVAPNTDKQIFHDLQRNLQKDDYNSFFFICL
jgi:hypothetical protein